MLDTAVTADEAMKKRMLYRHGLWLQHKRNYLIASTLSMGAFFAVAFLWAYGADRDAYFWLFVVLMALLGGFVWGLVMWELIGKNNAALINSALNRKADDSRSE